jgi:hypothetical protein
MTELVLIFGVLFISIFVSLSIAAFAAIANRKGSVN